MYERVKNKVFYFMKKIPNISQKIERERQKVYELIKNEVISRNEGLTYITALPDKALKSEEILNIVKSHLAAGNFVDISATPRLYFQKFFSSPSSDDV